MGNKSSIESKISISLYSHPNRYPLKFIDHKYFNGESFLYFKPNKKIKIFKYLVEIVYKNIDVLDTMQLHEIKLLVGDMNDYKKNGENHYEYCKELENATIFIRYDKQMYITELVYKTYTDELSL